MPETPIHEHHGPMPGHNQVRCARQVASVQSEAVSKAVDNRSHGKLGFHVFGSDSETYTAIGPSD